METIQTMKQLEVNYAPNHTNLFVKESKQAYKYCKDFYHQLNLNLQFKEYFMIVLLNRANEIIGYYKLSEGGISGTVVDVRIIFSIALTTLSSGIILCHNHPSGNLHPSESDIKVTRKVKEIASLMDIQLLDHLIITGTGKNYYSFADNGII